MLSQAIKGFIGGRFKYLANRITFFPLYFYRDKGFSASLVLPEYYVPDFIRKPDFTGRTQDGSHDFFSNHGNGVSALPDLKRGLAFLRDNNQTLLIGEFVFRGG